MVRARDARGLTLRLRVSDQSSADATAGSVATDNDTLMEIRDREVVGVEKICWGTDYPHYEGTYPNSRKAMRHTFHDVKEDDVRRMLGGNAAELYGFDLDKLGPIVERVGPTVEEVSKPLSADEYPTNTYTMAFRK